MCQGIPEVFPDLESVIHLAQMKCILTFETSWRSLVMLLFQGLLTTPSPSTALFSRTRFSGLSLRTTRSPLPRPTRGCRCSSPRRTGTCSRTGRGTPTSSTSRPRHTPPRPSPPRASSLQRSQTSGKKKEFTINLPKYNYCHNYHVSGRLLSEFS